MSSFPPPKRRSMSTPSKAKTDNSDKANPTKEQQETEETNFVAKKPIDSNFNGPKWKNRTVQFSPGYRFCPFDGELIVYYLQKKVNNESMPYNKIPDVNIYLHNPEYLADQYQALGDGTWYFFSPRDRKYRKGKRPKRAAGDGYWKATGADKSVEHRGVVVGKKKSLVFYLGKPPNGKKADWIMQEYTVDAPPRIKKDEYDMRLDDWVLCKIYKKAPGKSKRVIGQEEEEEEEEEKHENAAYTVTSLEKVADQCAKDKNNHVDNIHDFNTNGYIPPSRISAVLPTISDPSFPNYGNFAAYHPQQQVFNYHVQSVGIIPPHVHPTQGFFMSKYNFQENFGSISTMDNLLPPQLESMDTLSYFNSLLPNNSSTSPFL